MKRNLAVWTLFGLAFLANPALFACSSAEDEEFSYGEQEMKAAVLGDWQGVALVDGESIAFTLKLEQASPKSGAQSIAAPPIQPQCSSRSFVKSAGACFSVTTMPLVGTLTSESAWLTGVVEGEAMASRDLNPTSLGFSLEDGTNFGGSLAPDAITDGQINGDQPLGTFTLSRL